eukprot:598715-Pelagomonas_calceolata.AAC.3
MHFVCAPSSLCTIPYFCVQFEPDGNPIIRLSASGSTTCATCSTMNCGKNGFCEAFRNEAHCVCLNGWSGVNCETAPSACYGVSCQGQGVCVISDEGLGHCVCPASYSLEECAQAQMSQVREQRGAGL